MPSSTSSSEHLYPDARLPAARGGRWVVVAIAFVAAWFVGDRLLATCCQRLALASNFRFSRVYAGTAAAEIVFLGDSRGVNTFYEPAIERTCGRKGLNLAYNGCSAAIAAILLEDYLDRHPPPAAVVLEASCARQGDELLKSLRMFAAESPRLAAAVEAREPLLARAAKITRLYAFNSEMFLRAIYYLGRGDQAWINRYTINPTLLAAAEAARGQPLALEAPTEENLAAIRRIRDVCRERGIGFRCVIGPYLPPYRARLTNLDEWKARFTAATAVDVVDLSAAVAESGAFADNLHLNDRGAEMLTPALCDILPSPAPGTERP